MSSPRLALLPGPLAVALAAASGIAAAPWLDALGVPSGPRWLIAAAMVIAWRRAQRRRGALLLAVGLALGAARGARPEVVTPAGVTVDDRAADRVIGVVRGPVVHGPRGDGARLDTEAAAIWLWSDEHLVPGERVAATGVVRTPRGLRDPAVPDRADAAHARGAELELTARRLERLGDAGGPGAVIDRAWRWAGATQAAWAHAIDEAGGDPVGRTALRGIAVGDRGEVPPALDQRWRAVGIYHVEPRLVQAVVPAALQAQGPQHRREPVELVGPHDAADLGEGLVEVDGVGAGPLQGHDDQEPDDREVLPGLAARVRDGPGPLLVEQGQLGREERGPTSATMRSTNAVRPAIVVGVVLDQAAAPGLGEQPAESQAESARSTIMIRPCGWDAAWLRRGAVSRGRPIPEALGEATLVAGSRWPQRMKGKSNEPNESWTDGLT